MTVIIILLYFVVWYIGILKLVRKKQIKESVLYSAILIMAFTLSLLLSLDVEIPSPMKPIEQIVKNILGQ